MRDVIAGGSLNRLFPMTMRGSESAHQAMSPASSKAATGVSSASQNGPSSWSTPQVGM